MTWPYTQSREMRELLARLTEEHPEWWVELMGEHCHVGGEWATRWLLDRCGLSAGERMLDCGAFLGAAARLAATRTGARAVAADLGVEFLAAGRALPGGDHVEWILADTRRLPFPDGAFDSVWCLDTMIVPRELSRVARREGATLCLSCDAPNDSRGGSEAFLEEWESLGWRMTFNRQTGAEALQTWRTAEQDLAGRRRHYEERMGRRGYERQLDALAYLIETYDRSELGHGLFILRR